MRWQRIWAGFKSWSAAMNYRVFFFQLNRHNPDVLFLWEWVKEHLRLAPELAVERMRSQRHTARGNRFLGVIPPS